VLVFLELSLSCFQRSGYYINYLGATKQDNKRIKNFIMPVVVVLTRLCLMLPYRIRVFKGVSGRASVQYFLREYV
jgi:hypothetical protein